MATIKISALPAAVGANVTDATIFPGVDASAGTTKITLAQVRTQALEHIPNNSWLRWLDNTGVQQFIMTLDAFNRIQLLSPHDLIINVADHLTFLANVEIRFGAGGGNLVIDNGLASAPSATANDIALGATTQATVGAAGAATALPANPLGYWVLYKGATKIAIPYYNG